MNGQSGGVTTGVVAADPRDARKAATVFFAEMPWNGERLLDPGQWPAARFFELVCGAEEGASEERG